MMMATGFAAESKPKAAKRPMNVVLILVDDMGWKDLSCQGSDFYQTPQIDRLAADGMRFTNNYAACAVCSPTRAAVMTGRYPARVGVTDWIRAVFQRGKVDHPDKNPTEYVVNKNRDLACPPNPYWMELDEVTIPEALKPAGYASMHIGKWHLGDEPQYPEHQGFDGNFIGCDLGQPPTYHAPYKNKRYGFDPPIQPLTEDEFLTDRESIEAVKFITENKDRPFFLYMAHYAVHTPIMGKPDVIKKYEALKDGKGQNNATYAALVESVDDSTGHILDALDRLGLADNTLVIFTSDNGGLDRNGNPTENAPLRSGKGYAYEGGIRVPMIIRWPGVTEPGSVCDQPTMSIDLMPTVCHAAGVDLPSGRTIDGVDLTPALRGKKLPDRTLLWHFPHYRHGPGHDPYSIIRDGPWKLIRFYDPAKTELYNLADDISEEHDLAAKMPDKVKQLNAKLDKMLKDTGAKLPRPK
ncbi:sulfatase [Planctomycetales bacterium ZRK34]|nr:sulfatase [Planctomycetales bacterium ZRK34]